MHGFIRSTRRRVLNLSGQFRCVQGYIGPGPVYVTQNGWDLNLVNEVGQPSRAWINWPGQIWAQYWNEGAVYSPDGMAIQFDRGSVWVRDLAPFPPPPPVHFKGWRRAYSFGKILALFVFRHDHIEELVGGRPKIALPRLAA